MFKYLFFVFTIVASFNCFAMTVIKSTEVNPQDMIILYDGIDSNTAALIVAQIQMLQNVRPQQPLYLMIDSSGGEVLEGVKIINAMNMSKRPVYTVVVNNASSMAAYIHSYGKKRYMMPDSFLMFHQASWSYTGSIQIMENRIRFMKKLISTFDENVCKRSNVTLEELKRKESDEWWVLTDEALNRKLIDDVIKFEVYPQRIKKGE